MIISYVGPVEWTDGSREAGKLHVGPTCNEKMLIGDLEEESAAISV